MALQDPRREIQEVCLLEINTICIGRYHISCFVSSNDVANDFRQVCRTVSL